MLGMKKKKQKYNYIPERRICKKCKKINSAYIDNEKELDTIKNFCTCSIELPFHFEIPKDENLTEESYKSIYNYQ